MLIGAGKEFPHNLVKADKNYAYHHRMYDMEDRFVK